MKNLILLIGIILIPYGIFSATITGVISEPGLGTIPGKPMLGAKVILTTGSPANGTGPRLDSSISDSLGKYSLHVETSGIKQLLVYMAGHFPKSTYVSVEKDTGTYIANIILTPTAATGMILREGSERNDRVKTGAPTQGEMNGPKVIKGNVEFISKENIYFDGLGRIKFRGP